MIRLRVTRQSVPKKLRVLSRSRAFAGLREDELGTVAALVTRTSVPAGTVVVEEGRPDDTLYVVVRGAVEVTRHGELVRHLVAGDCFTGDGPAARAVTPVALLVATGRQRHRIAEAIGRPLEVEARAPAIVYDFRRRRGVAALRT